MSRCILNTETLHRCGPLAREPRQMTAAKAARNTIPPLPTLRAFEAVGRLGGIRRAAQALNVDHTVVSRHIRALEEWAGVRLIGRQGGAITLTSEGTRYHAKVSTSLADLAAASSELRKQADKARLVIWCVPGLASQWLTPRLQAFKEKHPDIDLELHPTDHSPDFTRFEADIDIRYVFGNGKTAATRNGVRRVEIARPRVLAVASPACAQALQSAATVEDWRSAPFLHEDTDDQWRAWLTALGVNLLGPIPGPRLWHAHLTLEGARSGQGVALANPFLVRDDLHSGRLVEIAPRGGAGNPVLGAYVFEARADRWQLGPIVRFRHWLKMLAAAHRMS